LLVLGIVTAALGRRRRVIRSLGCLAATAGSTLMVASSVRTRRPGPDPLYTISTTTPQTGG
jgi:hypothetical protein